MSHICQHGFLRGVDPDCGRCLRRERIATAALQGILANAAIAASPIGMVDAVTGAVEIADKMIAALDAKPESEEE